MDKQTETIGTKVLDAAFIVHRELGPGLLERIYADCLELELKEIGLSVKREVPIRFRYKTRVFEDAFRADLIVQNTVIVELKAVEELVPVFSAQLITYLKLTHLDLGYLINFNSALLKNGIRRFIRTHPQALQTHKLPGSATLATLSPKAPLPVS